MPVCKDDDVQMIMHYKGRTWKLAFKIDASPQKNRSFFQHLVSACEVSLWALGLIPMPSDWRNADSVADDEEMRGKKRARQAEQRRGILKALGVELDSEGEMKADASARQS